jgi:hypothetical protein
MYFTGSFYKGVLAAEFCGRPHSTSVLPFHRPNDAVIGTLGDGLVARVNWKDERSRTNPGAAPEKRLN